MFGLNGIRARIKALEDKFGGIKPAELVKKSDLEAMERRLKTSTSTAVLNQIIDELRVTGEARLDELVKQYFERELAGVLPDLIASSLRDDYDLEDFALNQLDLEVVASKVGDVLLPIFQDPTRLPELQKAVARYIGKKLDWNAIEENLQDELVERLQVAVSFSPETAEV